MTTSDTTTARTASGPSPGGSTTAGRSRPQDLATSQGNTQIAETVVSKIAGLAAREVHGVYKLGGGAARAFGAIRERIPGATTNASQGVSVEVGEKQAAIDLELAVEYGVAIPDLAAAVRRNVITALNRMTGLEIVEVNILVSDVHLPDEDESGTEGPAESRVQ